MKPIFVQLQCVPGKTYEVADAIYQTEICSELYSTSGEYDLLLKSTLPKAKKLGAPSMRRLHPSRGLFDH